MKYLDMVVKEVLRKHSPADSVLRATSQEYTIPKTQITLPAGVHVFVSIWAIHNDPDIYPNPNVFDPERFSDKCTQARHPMTFMPFGNGPKSCIGKLLYNLNNKKIFFFSINKFINSWEFRINRWSKNRSRKFGCGIIGLWKNRKMEKSTDGKICRGNIGQ